MTVRGSYLLFDEFADLIEGFEGFVGKGSFEAPPDLLGRVELGGIRWYEQWKDVGRPAQTPGFVEGSIVHEHDLEFIGLLGGKVIEEDLERGG